MKAMSALRISRFLALALLVATLLSLAGVLVLHVAGCSNSAGGFSLYETILTVGSALGFALLGALIVFYRPGNRIGWLCSVIGFTFLLGYFSAYFADCGIAGVVATPGTAWMAWLSYLAFPITVVLMFSLLPFLFPDGRFFSSVWQRLARLTTGVALISVLLTALVQGPLIYSSTDSNFEIDNPVGWLPESLGPLLENITLLAIIGAALAGIVSLIVRLLRAQGDMRLQLKWLFYFLAVAITTLLAIELFGDMVDEGIFASWIYLLVLLLVFWGLPAVIGLAVFKYRLYGIDVIIRRTVLYAALTAVLALVYFGSVTLLTNLFSSVTGQQSALAIVVSTLLIAALFAPLRRRVQGWIDRRFFRRKYDAQRVLAQFALSVRDETDLDALTSELVRVVQETMQPETMSVWLKTTVDQAPGRASQKSL